MNKDKKTAGDMKFISKEDVGLTTWENKTEDLIRFQLFVSHGVGKAMPNGSFMGTPASSYLFEVKPGEKLILDSKYDDGIRKVRNGYVVSGHAPQLTKVGETDIKIHPSMDPKKATREAKFLEAQKILAAKVAADQAYTIAVADQVAKEEKSKKGK